MSEILKQVIDRAGAVRRVLEDSKEQLVLAESCTAGMVAAALAHWPGISNWLCGSMVVYQSATKQFWLGINQGNLESPTIGPVSREVTDELSWKILEKTPQATLAAAVTGHLGPGAPPELDGVIFISISRRRDIRPDTANELSYKVAIKQQLRLPPLKLTNEESEMEVLQARQSRMFMAANHVLDCILQVLVTDGANG